MIALSEAKHNEYRGNATMSTSIYTPAQPILRKSERAESSFLETIVGRRGGLRPILSEVEAVAPPNSTVLVIRGNRPRKKIITPAVHQLQTPPLRNPFHGDIAPMPPR